MAIMRLITVIAAFGALAACGGGGGGSSTPASGPDAFTAAVRSVVAAAPDDMEPAAIDSTAVVEVDDKDAPPA